MGEGEEKEGEGERMKGEGERSMGTLLMVCVCMPMEARGSCQAPFTLRLS